MPSLALPSAIRLAAVGLAVTGLTLSLVITVSLIVLKLSGGKLLSVQTASMVPAFRPGDALIVKPVPLPSLKAGQIVSYRNPRDPNLTITHRLISVKNGWLTTAGDARHSLDPSFRFGLVQGRAVLLLPGLGRWLDFVRRPIGLALMVYLPVSLIIAAEVRRLSYLYTSPIYSARL